MVIYQQTISFKSVFDWYANQLFEGVDLSNKNKH